jgi:MYXO-CTERM domain-containing protein
MKRSLLVWVLAILLSPFNLFANDSGDWYELLHEDFEDAFPPQGWVLENENPEYSWAQVASVSDAWFNADSGSKFIYVEGGPDEQTVSTLITAPIETAEWSGKCADEMVGDIKVASAPVVVPGQIIRVEAITDFGETDEQRTLLKSWPGSDWQAPAQWLSIDEIYATDLVGQTFRLAFRYNGQEGFPIALDSLILACYKSDGGTHYDHSIDDGDNHDGCGCSTGSSSGAGPLVILMLAVGLGALLASTRRASQK